MAFNSVDRNPISVTRWQAIAGAIYLLILALVLMMLYVRDRQQEWDLRCEQAEHRLELAFELITRDLQRVRSDILFLTKQKSVVGFETQSSTSGQMATDEFANFLVNKQGYQQVRLLSLEGRELLRVDRNVLGDVQVTPSEQLQDKGQRYYVRESVRLKPGEVFVSDFDLNQEHGVIETPIRPVIRFVSPVADVDGQPKALLVLNYLGTPLLNDLQSISIPGQTLLTRADGEYLLAGRNDDAWGWLLGHERTFNLAYPEAWRQRSEECFLTGKGAFAFREIQLHRMGVREQLGWLPDANSIFIVSYLAPELVYEKSNLLLSRLFMLGIVILLPVLLLVRLWAQAAQRRQQQNQLLAESESRLRELSSRLVQIQEDERKAISREIHDQLGQQATAINLDLKMTARDAPEALRPQLERAIDESQQLLDTLHDFAGRIRPVELDDLGLHDAVASHLQAFSQRTHIKHAFHCVIADRTLPPVVAENVYRLIQEALNNVAKHSAATRVDVQIKMEHPAGRDDAAWLSVKISDDGIGVDENEMAASAEPKQVTERSGSGLGMLGMRERVELLGGTISLQSETDQGTTVRALVPLGISETVDVSGSIKIPQKQAASAESQP